MRFGAVRRIPRSLARLLIVGLVVLAPISAQLGAALAAPITVECCCGEHDADFECGCEDCLGAVYRSEMSQERSHHDRARPCGQEAPVRAVGVAPVPWHPPLHPNALAVVAERAIDPPPAEAMPPSAETHWSRAPS